MKIRKTKTDKSDARKIAFALYTSGNTLKTEELRDFPTKKQSLLLLTNFLELSMP